MRVIINFFGVPLDATALNESIGFHAG
jgi:hypothetical protein